MNVNKLIKAGAVAYIVWGVLHIGIGVTALAKLATGGAVSMLGWSLVTLYRAPMNPPGIPVRVTLIVAHTIFLGFCASAFLDSAGQDLPGLAVLIGAPSLSSIIALAWMPRLLVPSDHCHSCSYPLRGLRGPNCPECGERIEIGEA